MLTVNTLFVSIKKLSRSRYFIYTPNEHIGTMNLKKLFIWHEESFFGSMLETKTEGRDIGFVISAWDLLTLFGRRTYNSFLPWEWDEPLQVLHDVGPDVYKAIQHAKVQPTVSEDGTKLLWSLPEELFAQVDDKKVWTINSEEQSARLFLQTIVTESMENLVNKHAAQEQLSPQEIVAYFDEQKWQEWLRGNDTPLPFTIGLRLSEPEEGATEWHLETVLKDRNSEAIFPLSSSLPRGWKKHIRAVEQEQTRWERLFPWLYEDGQMKDRLSDEEAWTFLSSSSETLTALGVPIFLPSWWESIRKASVQVKATVKQETYRSYVGMNALLDFDWRLSINGKELSEEEFQQLVHEKRNLVRINGQWVQLDHRLIQRLKVLMEEAKEKGVSMSDLLHQQLGDEPLVVTDTEDERELAKLQFELSRSLKQWLRQLTNPKDIPLLPTPFDLQATLRPYQQFGMSWLYFLREHGFGACLADDMGLGKTIQLIAYLLHVREKEAPDTPALIICPTSVLGNWQRELERFAPSLRVGTHYGSHRTKGEDFTTWAASSDVILTTYTLAHLDFDELSSVKWSTIALDEAQNIKNANTKQSRAIRKLKGQHHIALTGTPMENRLSELWAIFDFMNRGYLGSFAQFQKRFIVPIERDEEVDRIQALQKLIRPFLLRRLKTDKEVALNLPDKLEQKEYCPLTDEQAALYEQLIQDTFAELPTLTGLERRGKVLQMLNQLKQLCNHPALYLKETAPANLLKRSEKLQKTLDLITACLDQNEACLLFTQYLKMGEIIQQVIKKHFGIDVPFLNGSMPKQQRDDYVQRFQEGEFPIFLLSLKAGGTGLNLTAANHVIHYDRWWNPAVEHQATDRAYRIGQQRFVHVHKLITVGTLEEKIDIMLEKKQSLNDQIIQSEQWVTELSDEELYSLLALT
jgi:SNF2 family DNA or RNA helicase